MTKTQTRDPITPRRARERLERAQAAVDRADEAALRRDRAVFDALHAGLSYSEIVAFTGMSAAWPQTVVKRYGLDADAAKAGALPPELAEL